MKNKILIISLIIFVSFFAPSKLIFAQTPLFQKALEAIENLINIKDDKDNNFSLRIEALEKIINLSLEEIKNIKIKLLTLENLDASSTLWLENNIAKINEIIKFYENQKKFILDNEIKDLETIKTRAKEIKDVREKEYLPLSEEIYNLLVIQQQKKALETAKLRAQKIKIDLNNLKNRNFKNINLLLEKFNEAQKEIKKAQETYEKANNLFWQKINFAQDKGNNELKNKENNELNLKSEQKQENLIEIENENKEEIKNLINQSFENIKKAYQLFIEMSNISKK